jgi:hypothetical protein
VSAPLSSVRRKLLGETRTIPIGIATAVLLVLLLRTILPHSEWRLVGGFALAAALIATLIRSLSLDKRHAGGVNPPTERD